MSSISSFLLTMALHPDFQAKAQDEIDRVVGCDRLPTLEDRKSLPYVEAIYREVMRLNPPLPLGKLLMEFNPSDAHANNPLLYQDYHTNPSETIFTAVITFQKVPFVERFESV